MEHFWCSAECHMLSPRKVKLYKKKKYLVCLVTKLVKNVM